MDNIELKDEIEKLRNENKKLRNFIEIETGFDNAYIDDMLEE